MSIVVNLGCEYGTIHCLSLNRLTWEVYDLETRIHCYQHLSQENTPYQASTETKHATSHLFYFILLGEGYWVKNINILQYVRLPHLNNDKWQNYFILCGITKCTCFWIIRYNCVIYISCGFT